MPPLPDEPTPGELTAPPDPELTGADVLSPVGSAGRVGWGDVAVAVAGAEGIWSEFCGGLDAGGVAGDVIGPDGEPVTPDVPADGADDDGALTVGVETVEPVAGCMAPPAWSSAHPAGMAQQQSASVALNGKVGLDMRRALRGIEF